MRIVSGDLGGRLINPPSFFTARPTTDLAKESLFNVLNNRVNLDGLRALDLFAGSGSISFEFASRGAQRVVSVEQNPRYVAFIEQTAKSFGVQSMHVLRADVFRYLERYHELFDVVFADPPYDLPNLASIPDLFFSSRHLQDEGWFILEHSGSMDFSNHPHFVELRRYGKVHFTFFR